jgi:hypothetical protein
MIGDPMVIPRSSDLPRRTYLRDFNPARSAPSGSIPR